MSENLPATGQAGAEPPPGAPNEVSQPLQHDAGGIVFASGESMTPASRARQNEQVLKPLTYGLPTQGGVAEAVDAAKAGTLDPFYTRRLADVAAEGKTSTTIKRVRRASSLNRPPVPAPAAEGVEGASVRDANEATVATGPAVAPDRSGAVDVLPPAGTTDPTAPVSYSHMPAMSDSDSPARGIPRVPVRAGKEITGGFADQIAAQYFAINGQELRVLCEALMDEIYNRLQNDLRFNEAITYPQVCAKVLIEISGFAHDNDFTVEAVIPTTHAVRTKTPSDIARQFADEVVFVILAERKEVDANGESVDTPDAMRIDLGLQRPNKRPIRTGGTETWADI